LTGIEGNVVENRPEDEGSVQEEDEKCKEEDKELKEKARSPSRGRSEDPEE
jgi:hypothetical protein